MKQSMQVLTSRETVEWLTPAWLIEAARDVLGTIDLDPASCAVAQSWIQAERVYTAATDGLNQEWRAATVWLNPPFDDTARWVDKLTAEYNAGRVREALLLVNANLGYRWFEELWRRYPVCLLKERVRFLRADGSTAGQAKRAQAVVCVGANWRLFQAVFGRFGKVVFP